MGIQPVTPNRLLAGAGGIEPTLPVLETGVLPLNDAPVFPWRQNRTLLDPPRQLGYHPARIPEWTGYKTQESTLDTPSAGFSQERLLSRSPLSSPTPNGDEKILAQLAQEQGLRQIAARKNGTGLIIGDESRTLDELLAEVPRRTALMSVALAADPHMDALYVAEARDMVSRQLTNRILVLIRVDARRGNTLQDAERCLRGLARSGTSVSAFHVGLPLAIQLGITAADDRLRNGILIYEEGRQMSRWLAPVTASAMHHREGVAAVRDTLKALRS